MASGSPSVPTNDLAGFTQVLHRLHNSEGHRVVATIECLQIRSSLKVLYLQRFPDEKPGNTRGAAIDEAKAQQVT